jgi:hypothetical protein
MTPFLVCLTGDPDVITDLGLLLVVTVLFLSLLVTALLTMSGEDEVGGKLGGQDFGFGDLHCWRLLVAAVGWGRRGSREIVVLVHGRSASCFWRCSMKVTW